MRFIIMASFFALACSSLPNKVEEQALTTKAAQAKDYSRIGNENKDQGNFTQAERNFNLSLDMNFSIDNLEGIAESYNSLGNLYLEIDDSEGAQSAFDEALKFAKFANMQSLVAKSRVNQAKVLLYKKKYPESISLLQEIQASLGKEDKELLAITLTNLGLAQLRSGNPQAAIISLDAAKKIHIELKSIKELANVLYITASAYNQGNDINQARSLILEALTLDKSVENSFGIATDLFALYQIEIKQNKKSEAYIWLERYFRVNLGSNNVVSVKKALGLLIALAKELGYDREIVLWTKYHSTMEK